eukprot:gnl/Dysnectes_brevis/5482_a7904_495.p1 GENE.gnl/Dysnectes_brevis/5482_a7904_495~~gnl/Dysnectes_brevis/5482_a7904_495.p1  ORF type:complete len:282 (+),score=15.46 gnl/Dysnectes_brevis/5482_a7904_495:72-917(+)
MKAQTISLLVLSVLAIIQTIISIGYPDEVYAKETNTMKVQAVAQDYTTLIVGIPYLWISYFLSDRKSSSIGYSLTLGASSYFLYTYISYAFLCGYSSMFLLYIALIVSAGYSFVFSLLAVIQHPRKVSKSSNIWPTVVVFSFSALFVGGLWLSILIPSALSNTTPEILTESGGTTLVIQAMDLSLVLPTVITAMVLLHQRHPSAHLFVSIVYGKAMLLGAAVGAMGVCMHASGERVSAVEMAMGPSILAMGVAGAVHYYRHLVPCACSPNPDEEGEVVRTE